MHKPANILFCYSSIPSFTNAVRDYVNAFGVYSRHSVHYLDMDSSDIPHDLTPYDAIIFNYCYWARCLNMPEDAKARVRHFDGMKIAILQDEYDYFLWHQKTLIDIRIDTIITCVPQQHWRDVFRDSYFDSVTFMNALTGYVPDGLGQNVQIKPWGERRWYLGYRARPVPFVYGRLTHEKLMIGVRMRAICAERGIPANIETSEESRIYGEDWPRMIGDCRAMLGTESGSNLFDFEGTVKPAVEQYIAEHPDVDFETVHARFMAPVDGNIMMNQISPRIFETIALRTALVLFEGEYSGVVMPWKHYIPLKKDFSNLDEVFVVLEDEGRLTSITENAYADVIASGKYSFRHYIAQVDALIDRRLPKGYEACYGIIGWRHHDDAWHPEKHAIQRVPMRTPLRHIDAVADPILRFNVSMEALHRRCMKQYAAWLYSPLGKRIQAGLKQYPQAYAALRTIVRTVTGRR
ncbi:MAG: hypothetical protein C0436_03205 [Alphaproteobacteria bacterium]|nr:hypothetical protein [Alphaproteobacteria bacterium]